MRGCKSGCWEKREDREPYRGRNHVGVTWGVIRHRNGNIVRNKSSNQGGVQGSRGRQSDVFRHESCALTPKLPTPTTCRRSSVLHPPPPCNSLRLCHPGGQLACSLAHPFKPYTLTLRPHPKLAMSFFGRAPQAPSGSINPQQIEMAEAELSMISDIFDRIVRSCHSKCISEKYAEPDLNKGEGVCIDRCVAKFFEVNAKVGERMQTMGGAAQAGGSFGQ